MINHMLFVSHGTFDVCILTHGIKIQCGNKASQKWQCDTSVHALLGNLESIQLHVLHCCKPST